MKTLSAGFLVLSLSLSQVAQAAVSEWGKSFALKIVQSFV